MIRRLIYAFDCGTTNWRLYRLSGEETVNENGIREVRATSEPQLVGLSVFAGRHLPAALLLDEQSQQISSYGRNAYEIASDGEMRPLLRDAFKLCFGNRDAGDPFDLRRRYTHENALTYTRLLLHEVIQRLNIEKPGALSANNHFLFAHPVHWGRAGADGTITGEVLSDFADLVRACFPPEVQENIHFVPEPEAALVSLSQTGHLSGDGSRYTLVVDVGGGTSDFVAGRWTSGGLQDVRYYGEAHGGGLFDHDLASYIAEMLQVPTEHRDEVWPELREYGRRLKENLSQQMRMNPNIPVTMKIMVELPEQAPQSIMLRFQQKEFEARTKHTTNAFERLVLRALVKMDLRKSDVGQVVLVGGGSNLYLVPKLFKSIFGGSIVIAGDPPEEIVARGTALWWTQLGQSQEIIPSVEIESKPPASPIPAHKTSSERESLLQDELNTLLSRYVLAQEPLQELDKQRQQIVTRIDLFRQETRESVRLEVENLYLEITPQVSKWVEEYTIQFPSRYIWGAEEETKKIFTEVFDHVVKKIEEELTTWVTQKFKPSLNARLEVLKRDLDQTISQFIKQVDELRLKLTQDSISAEADKIIETVPPFERVLVAGGGVIGDVGLAVNPIISDIIKSQKMVDWRRIMGDVPSSTYGKFMAYFGNFIVHTIERGSFIYFVKSMSIKYKNETLNSTTSERADEMAEAVMKELGVMQEAVDQGLRQEIRVVQDLMDSTLNRIKMLENKISKVA